MSEFIENEPLKETLWRSIILFGRNAATYKFALGKSLLEFANKEKTFVTLNELAEPYSKHISNHLILNDKQAIFSKGRFLDTCRLYNNGSLNKDELINITVRFGFRKVIDAFHMVNQANIPKRFFIDERRERNGINITDELLSLKEQAQFKNLFYEVEARWRLVETAWSLNINPNLLEIRYDDENNMLFTENKDRKRINITSSRDSLNGYQKGKCFYCFKDIYLDNMHGESNADIDHFFPHSLFTNIKNIDFNGVWNLVLSCRECNRGENGKFARIPEKYLLERLFNRNEYLIVSHHPLRETIINQTGKLTESRKIFLQNIDLTAIKQLIHRWRPATEYDAGF